VAAAGEEENSTHPAHLTAAVMTTVTVLKALTADVKQDASYLWLERT
jgi:hypothetical protein